MTDYRATKVDGTSYVRANEVLIINTYGQPPRILFNEELVLNVGGQTMRQAYTAPLPALPLLETFGESNEPFNLLNPNTGAVIGKASNSDLHVLLYSKYRHLTDLRDQAMEAHAKQLLLQQQAEEAAQAAAQAAAQEDGTAADPDAAQ